MNDLKATEPISAPTTEEPKKKRGTVLFTVNLIHLILYGFVLPSGLSAYVLYTYYSGVGLEGWDSFGWALGTVLIAIISLVAYLIVALICSAVGILFSALLLKRAEGAHRTVSIITLVLHSLFLLLATVGGTVLLVLSITGS